jgi:hypothetical protein
VLANAVLYDFDAALTKFCDLYEFDTGGVKIRYSRYGDDVCLSVAAEDLIKIPRIAADETDTQCLVRVGASLLQEISVIGENLRWYFNKTKWHVQHRGQRMRIGMYNVSYVRGGRPGIRLPAEEWKALESEITRFASNCERGMYKSDITQQKRLSSILYGRLSNFKVFDPPRAVKLQAILRRTFVFEE